jgi:hypothetical protein
VTPLPQRARTEAECGGRFAWEPAARLRGTGNDEVDGFCALQSPEPIAEEFAVVNEAAGSESAGRVGGRWPTSLAWVAAAAVAAGAVGVVVLSANDSDEERAPRPAASEVGSAAREYAAAVASRRMQRICELLAGDARRTFSCDDGSADVPPVLNIAGRSFTVAVTSATPTEAVARIDGDATRGFPKQCRDSVPHLLTLARPADRWQIVAVQPEQPEGPVRPGACP